MIVGVHGIAQQQLGARQLLRDWVPALTDGVAAAHGVSVGDVPMDLAFYGNLFLTPGRPGRMGPGDGDLEDLQDEELVDLVEAAHEVLREEDIAAAEQLPPQMGYTRTPVALQGVLRALDARFGRAGGVLYLGTLRQVRRYLVDPQLKGRADEIVANAVTSGCRILIGHSLGSVLALEYVRQHPEHELALLLTLGSPLGLRMVQSLLPEPFFGAGAEGGRPGNVAAWVNVRDVRDPVACAGDLGVWWSGLQDRHVDNEGDAHNVARYLSKQECGAAILAAAPQLADLAGGQR
jgi:hypothetical protein